MTTVSVTWLYELKRGGRGRPGPRRARSLPVDGGTSQARKRPLLDQDAGAPGIFSLDALGFEPGVDIDLLKEDPTPQLNEGDLPGLYEPIKGSAANAQICLDIFFR